MSKEKYPTDTSLIEQYKSGVTSVLPLLVKRWHRIFCEKAYWITKDKEAAKDVAQDSWMTIIAKMHTLKSAKSFKSWALRIVYTKAIDHVKSRSRANQKLKSIASDELDSESKGNTREYLRKSLLVAIQQLPKEKQVVIRLFYMEEYTLNEISTFLNIPVGTVKSRLFKTREKLKSLLKNNKYEK